jgi:hypothetical protein
MPGTPRSEDKPVSDTTDPVTAWLDDAGHVIADATGCPDAEGVVLVAETLLAVVKKVLAMHSPMPRYWCKECTTLHPCTTRRKVTSALLGEAGQ